MVLRKRLQEGLDKVERHAAVISTTKPDWFPQFRETQAKRVKAAVEGTVQAKEALRGIGKMWNRGTYEEGSGSHPTPSYRVHEDIHAAPCLPSEETVSKLESIAFQKHEMNGEVDEAVEGLVGHLEFKHEESDYHESSLQIDNQGGDNVSESLFAELEQPMQDSYNVLTAGYNTQSPGNTDRSSEHPYLTMLKPTYDMEDHYQAVLAGRKPV